MTTSDVPTDLSAQDAMVLSTITEFLSFDSNGLIWNLRFIFEDLYDVTGVADAVAGNLEITDRRGNIADGDLGIVKDQNETDAVGNTMDMYYTYTDTSDPSVTIDDTSPYHAVSYNSIEAAKLTERFGVSIVDSSVSSWQDGDDNSSWRADIRELIYEDRITELIRQSLAADLSVGYSFKKIRVSPLATEEITQMPGTELGQATVITRDTRTMTPPDGTY